MTKSKVDRPDGLKYLGFGFFFDTQAQQYKARPHAKSIAKLKTKMKWLTRRNWSVSNRYKIEKLNQLTRGWINYFGIGYMKWLCKDMDALIRRRLRMCIWVHWKTPQNRAKNLIKLGMYSKKAYAIAYSGARVARLSEGALNYVITNKRLASFGLVSMYDYYTERFVTVSYTHLDVYKRQDHSSFFIVYTDAERIFFNYYLQFFSLDHCLICSIF